MEKCGRKPTIALQTEDKAENDEEIENPPMWPILLNFPIMALLLANFVSSDSEDVSIFNSGLKVSITILWIIYVLADIDLLIVLCSSGGKREQQSSSNWTKGASNTVSTNYQDIANHPIWLGLYFILVLLSALYLWTSQKLHAAFFSGIALNIWIVALFLDEHEKAAGTDRTNDENPKPKQRAGETTEILRNLKKKFDSCLIWIVITCSFITMIYLGMRVPKTGKTIYDFVYVYCYFLPIAVQFWSTVFFIVVVQVIEERTGRTINVNSEPDQKADEIDDQKSASLQNEPDTDRTNEEKRDQNFSDAGETNVQNPIPDQKDLDSGETKYKISESDPKISDVGETNDQDPIPDQNDSGDAGKNDHNASGYFLSWFW